MSRSSLPEAPPSGTTATCSESVIAIPDPDEDSTTLDRELTLIQSPPRKRQKTEDGGGEATAASDLNSPVSALLDLPLDVLLEILTHVDPMSLRHVSRTSRALRDTLTCPRSNWIWRASYANTDHELPPAPDEMTVPQFLSLLVDRVCDFCQATPSPKQRFERIWAARIKSCNDCLYIGEHVVCEEDMCQFDLVCLIQRHLGPEFPLHKVLPASKDYGLSRLYPRVHIDRLNQDYVRDKIGGGSGDDIKAWIIQRAERHEGVIKHAEACYEWERQEERKRRKKEEEIRAERLKAIKQRLKDLDIDVDEPQEFKKQLSTRLKTPPIPQYCKRDKYFPTPVHSTPIEIYNLVREAQPLTEEDWSTIRDWLFQAATAEKRRQILEGRYFAFKKAYYQFLNLKSRREQRMLPSICTLANWEEVVDVIEGTSLEQDLSENDMCAFVDGLAQTRFSEWRADFEAELVAKLNAADPECEHPATVADLELATSVFSLRDSAWPVWYPELLSWSPWAWGMHRPETSYYAVRQCPPWSAHDVQVDGWRRRLASRLVSMAGLDPATATNANMAVRGVWFARADEVAMLHHGKTAYLLPWNLAMLGAQEGSEYVIFRNHDEVCQARAWLADPSALV